MKQMVFLLLVLASHYCLGQNYEAEKFEKSVLKAPNGAVIVYNGTTHAFQFSVVADSIAFIEHPDFLFLDDVAFQTLILPFPQKLDFANLTPAEQKSHLLGFMKYEMDYIKGIVGEDELGEKFEFLELAGKTFIFWTYDMPKSMKKQKDVKGVEQQHYLVTICFDQLLIINVPVDVKKNGAKLKTMMLTHAGTLQLHNQPVDLDELYYKLNEE